MRPDRQSAFMPELLRRRARVSVGGCPIFSFPESAREYPSFINWWLTMGKLRPGSSSEWSTISGPGAAWNRIELISEGDWDSLNADDAEALREWIESIPCGVLYD